MKRCPRCDQTKSLSEFYIRSSGNPNSWCKSCTKSGENKAFECDGYWFAVCTKCKEVKFTSEFDRRGENYQHWCKACREANRQLKYMTPEHKEQNAKTKRKRYERCSANNKEYIGNYLKTHPCVDCGEPDWVVLEFDHVRGKKEHTIANLAKQGYDSLNRIIEEIKKCDVVCANCHRRRTYKRAGSWRVA